MCGTCFGALCRISFYFFAEIVLLFLPGSHGCNVFSSEPEDESAGAGASGSFQFSPETQHEETHLNRHVDTQRSSSSFGLPPPPQKHANNTGACRHSASPNLTSPFLNDFYLTHPLRKILTEQIKKKINKVKKKNYLEVGQRGIGYAHT